MYTFLPLLILHPLVALANCSVDLLAPFLPLLCTLEDLAPTEQLSGRLASGVASTSSNCAR